MDSPTTWLNSLMPGEWLRVVGVLISMLAAGVGNLSVTAKSLRLLGQWALFPFRAARNLVRRLRRKAVVEYLSAESTLEARSEVVAEAEVGRNWTPHSTDGERLLFLNEERRLLDARIQSLESTLKSYQDHLRAIISQSTDYADNAVSAFRRELDERDQFKQGTDARALFVLFIGIGLTAWPTVEGWNSLTVWVVASAAVSGSLALSVWIWRDHRKWGS